MEVISSLDARVKHVDGVVTPCTSEVGWESVKFHSVEDFLHKQEISGIGETHCSLFDCVENLDESITGEISSSVTPEFVIASEVNLMCADDKHNSLVEFQLCATEHGNRNSMNDPVVVNEAKTCKLDKADQGAVSLKYCRPEDSGLRDLPVREPEVTDPGCGAVLADQMSAGAGGYLPEGWLILGVLVQHRLKDRGCGLHLRNHRRRHWSGGRRRGRGHRHGKIKDYVKIDIDHEVSVIIDINRKD